MDNDTIRGLKNDINVLTNLINRDKNDIAATENNLSKESAVLNQLVSDNSHLNDLIEDRNAQINNINTENAGLKKTTLQLIVITIRTIIYYRHIKSILYY